MAFFSIPVTRAIPNPATAIRGLSCLNENAGDAMTTREILDMSEQRIRLWEQQNFRCASCKRPHGYPDTMETAHHISQSKANLDRWGKQIIHHDLNVAAVCRGNSRCNSRQSVNPDSMRGKRLVARIKGALKEPMEA